MHNGIGLPTTGAGLPTTGAGLSTTGAGLPTTGAGLSTTGAGLPTTGAGLQTTTTSAAATAIAAATATGTAADITTDTTTNTTADTTADTTGNAKSTGSTSIHTTKLGKKSCSANHKYVKHINRLDKVKDMVDILARKRNKLRVTQSKQYSIRRILAGQALGQWTVLDTPTKVQDEKNLVVLRQKLPKQNVKGKLKRVSRGLLKFRLEERMLVEKVCCLISV